MKIFFCIIIACLSEFAITYANGPCPNGYWGDDCMNICGECSVFNLTDGQPLCYRNGTCSTGSCLYGYSGEKCDQALCPGGCGSGKCLSPGYCYGCYSPHQAPPDCSDIRLRGLAGSLLSFAVITASFSLCGIGAVKYSQRLPRRI